MKENIAALTEKAMQLTKTVTTRWTSRIAGSSACLESADFLREYVEKFCDETEIHPFKVRPAAFLGYLKINVFFYFATIVALFFQQFVVAAILAIISIVIMVFEFYFFKEFVDFLFPEKDGKNVLGTIEPNAQVKQQIILSGHHDSAHIFNFLTNDPSSYVRKIMIASLAFYVSAITCLVLLGLQWAYYVSPILTYIVMGVVIILGFWVGQLLKFYRKEGTPGAGDNMICSAIAMEVGRHFSDEKKSGNGLKHTRIVVASWDAEEAGLRGARAYVKKHKVSLQSLKTYNFNLECMYDHKELGLITSDINGFVKHSSAMVDEGIAIGKQLGYVIKKVDFPLFAGGTDAAEFSKMGVEATTLAGMSWESIRDFPAYHTPRDTIEAVDSKAVEMSIALSIQYVLEKDKQLRHRKSAQ